MNNKIKEAARFDTWQLRAIRHKEGPMLVLAGPGSGKTTVLTNRVKYLTEECGVKPENILVITFTRLAAIEMKERYLKLSGRTSTAVTFGTFHSVFLRILEEYSPYKDFRIADRSDCIKVLQGVFLQKYGKDSFYMTFVNDMLDVYSGMKNGKYQKNLMAEETLPLYEEAMQREKLLDFDDMLILCRNLLKENEELRKKLSEKYRYVLIDEFQDINKVQYDTVKLLAGSERNVFIVGDDDQSIYGFRGSDPSFMKEFLRDFRPVKKVELSRNYRSAKSIVKVSKKLISHNRNRFRKNLRTPNGKGVTPFLINCETEDTEALYIEDAINKYRMIAGDSGFETLTFAILARTHNALERVTSKMSRQTLSDVYQGTFHSSKGLEFDVVFLIGVNEGITPEKRSMHESNLEEERRIFYVAMTRAKKFLHILYTDRYYNKNIKKSRFVEEIM